MPEKTSGRTSCAPPASSAAATYADAGGARTAILRVDNVSHKYVSSWAVSDVSFSVFDKGVCGLLGANGAGKSTTLNSVCGVITPTRGSIALMGYDTVERPLEAKRQLGFLPQNAPVYLEQTVDEYLSFCCRLRGLSKSETTDAVESAKRKVGINHFSKRLIGALSGGFRQRVGIAQAIIHEPSIVVLDEPTNGLDPVQVSEVRDLIREIASDSLVLISTHILREVEVLCDRIMMMSTGRMVFDGTIEQFRDLNQSSAFRLSVKKHVTADTFEELCDIQHVESHGSGRYTLTFKSQGSDTSERIADWVKAKDLGLRELYFEKQSLEDVFAKLSVNDHPH